VKRLDALRLEHGWLSLEVAGEHARRQHSDAASMADGRCRNARLKTSSGVTFSPVTRSIDFASAYAWFSMRVSTEAARIRPPWHFVSTVNSPARPTTT
jgi:hypothetical protein